jgi:hypothetical protein
MNIKKFFRCTFGGILGGCAALSLTAIVLPSVLVTTGLHEELLVRSEVGGYTMSCVLVYAVGGSLTAWVGIPKRGTLILGFIGLLCGVIVALMAYPGETDRLLSMALAAGAHGAVVGLLLGHVLQKPREEEAAS